MQIHNLIQGSAEWHHFRKDHLPASEAPAMLGVSPYKTRSELLHERSTGLIKEVDATTQSRFDDGHRFEALARPFAEEIIGGDLFPVVGSLGKLSASFDGLTMDESICFEHKTLNDDIRSASSAADLGLHLRVQMEQQLYISGAEKCLFFASRFDDHGDLIESVHHWYFPDLDLRAKILAGWEQFEKDLASYVPVEVKEAPTAEVIEQLPAVVINVTGSLSLCNLDQVTPKFDAFLDNAKTTLKTDEDFINAAETAKFSRETAKRLKEKSKEVIAQISSVNEVILKLVVYEQKFDALGLKLEKLVKSETDLRKLEIINARKLAFGEHVAALEKEIAPIRLNVVTPDFAEAIKGKRNISSFHNAADTALANGKIAADAQAKDYRAKLTWFNETASKHAFLFADMQQIISKADDDFKLLVNTRINEHQAAEVKKFEEERARIQAEEEAKAKIKVEIDKNQADQRPTPVVAPAPFPFPTKESDKASTPTLRLGQISDRLGFAVTADFLRSLGFESSGRERASVLYHEEQFPLICTALIRHIVSVSQLKAA